jgi:carbonic anhydrase/acetyltransferase-like protein (isoleucine patch superfamily)
VVGTSSVVLYDSVMEPGARLDALSLIMKGETLPEGTSWAGVPATWRDWRDWRDWPDNAPARAPDITPADADDAVRSGSAA